MIDGIEEAPREFDKKRDLSEYDHLVLLYYSGNILPLRVTAVGGQLLMNGFQTGTPVILGKEEVVLMTPGSISMVINVDKVRILEIAKYVEEKEAPTISEDTDSNVVAFKKPALTGPNGKPL